jgi:hypothetical protein
VLLLLLLLLQEKLSRGEEAPASERLFNKLMSMLNE